MKSFHSLIFAILLLSCAMMNCTTSVNDLEINSILKNLKDHQGKVIVEIDGKKFYDENRIFTGSVMVASTSIRANLYDSLRSNVIASVMMNDWYKSKNKVYQVKAGENTNVNILIGKIIDPNQNKGIGYLFMNGQCKIMDYSKEVLVFKFEGLTAEYMKMSSQNQWQKIAGYIVIKKPKYEFLDIDEKSFFKN